MFQQSFLFFLPLILFVYSNPNNCSGGHLINPPNEIGTPWYYPDGWKESDTPPRFEANQTCIWKINVPKGQFAYLTITGATNSTKLTVIDSVGNEDWVPSVANTEPYFLLDPQFSVYLDSKSEGTLGMRIIWQRIGTFNPSSEQVLPNTVPTVKSSGDFDNGLIIYSNTNVSLVSIRPPTKAVEMTIYNMYMRNTVVFDGRSMDDKLIGNLWQIYELDNHVVSSGKYLTLYSLIPSIKSDSYALIQDYENVRQFSTYKGVSCFDYLLCSVIIDARKGLAAAIRMSSVPHFLEEVTLADNATMTVYTGTLEPSHQLVQYTNSQKFSGGQKFNGIFTTYTVDKTYGIEYQSNADSSWTSVFDGRNGILASKNYGSLSSDQNVLETFTGPVSDIYKLMLNVKSDGLTDDAILTVVMSSQGNLVFSEKYTSKQLPPATINASGNSVTINYNTNGSKTNGTLLNFCFNLKSSTATTESIPTASNGTTSASTPETTTKIASKDYSLFVVIWAFLHTLMF